MSGRGAEPRAGVSGRLVEVMAFALPVALAAVYLKYASLRFGGLEIAGRALGIDRFGVASLLGFFAGDLAEALLLLPLLLIAAGWRLPRRPRIALYAVVGEVVLLAAAVAFGTEVTLGRYPTPALVVEFLHAYRADATLVDPMRVLPPRQLLKIAALLGLGVLPFALFRLQRLAPRLRRWIRLALAGLPLVGAAGAGVVLACGTPSAYHKGLGARLLAAAREGGSPALPDPTGLSPAELLRRYREVAFPGGLPPAPPGPSVPVASRPDVLVVVLETASARDYDPTKRDGPMPRTAELLDHALVGLEHLSSYPYSVRANFTLFSSVYDLDGREMFADHLLGTTPRPMDALPSLLADRGYETIYLFPDPLIHANEAWLLPYLGFEVLEVGEGRPAGSSADRVARERAAFRRAAELLGEPRARRRPRLVALVTALGHAPYPELPGGAEGEGAPVADERTATARRIRDLVRFTDDLLGDLFDELRARGRLRDTLVVVTGDHGVRTRAEDPSLDLRVLARESFHVPLLVHYPPAIPETRRIPWITSHVDVAPTVLALMGLREPGWLHQGLPVTDPRLEDRVTFFLGGHYLGSNGLHHRGRFFMVNEVAGLRYLAPRFAFGPETLVGPDGPRAREAEVLHRRLRAFRRMELAWASYFRAASTQASTSGSGVSSMASRWNSSRLKSIQSR